MVFYAESFRYYQYKPHYLYLCPETVKIFLLGMWIISGPDTQSRDVDLLTLATKNIMRNHT